MTTLGSSMLILERRLRMGIVAVVAVSIPLVIWWLCMAFGFSGRGLDGTHAAADLLPMRSRRT